MKKRYPKLAALIAVTACTVLGVLAMLPDRPGVTKANFDRIQNGMAIREVEVILGRHPNVEGDGNQGHQLFWTNEDGSCVMITLGSDAKVCGAYWLESHEGVGRKFCRWIRWPWW